MSTAWPMTADFKNTCEPDATVAPWAMGWVPAASANMSAPTDVTVSVPPPVVTV